MRKFRREQIWQEKVKSMKTDEKSTSRHACKTDWGNCWWRQDIKYKTVHGSVNENMSEEVMWLSISLSILSSPCQLVWLITWYFFTLPTVFTPRTLFDLFLSLSPNSLRPYFCFFSITYFIKFSIISTFLSEATQLRPHATLTDLTLFQLITLRIFFYAFPLFPNSLHSFRFIPLWFISVSIPCFS